ncbi:MAG TPA: hypothetical protein VL306_00805 [Methylomirabilota bacterium]|nr:hypothetical protein [Methylomirabilota bacterium]
MKSKNKIIFLSLLLGLLLVSNVAHAALINCGGRGATGQQPDCQIGDIIVSIKNIINFLLSWAWLISTFLIVVSGFKMVFAAGNEEAISSAKTSLSHAIIGFIIIMLSFLIVNFVIGLLTGGGAFSPDALMGSFNLIP